MTASDGVIDHARTRVERRGRWLLHDFPNRITGVEVGGWRGGAGDLIEALNVVEIHRGVHHAVSQTQNES